MNNNAVYDKISHEFLTEKLEALEEVELLISLKSIHITTLYSQH